MFLHLIDPIRIRKKIDKKLHSIDALLVLVFFLARSMFP